MNSVWTAIPLGLSLENSIQIAEIICLSEENYGEDFLFEKIVINKTLPQNVININKKKTENYICKEAGVIGSVFVRVNDICAEIQSECFKDYSFCTTVAELTKENFVVVSAYFSSKTVSITIKIFLNEALLHFFDENKRRSNKRVHIYQHVRVLLSSLYPNDVTPTVCDQRIDDTFMNLVTSNKFLKNFKHETPFKSVINEHALAQTRITVPLYPYQIKTICWMIERESFSQNNLDPVTVSHFVIPIFNSFSLFYDNYSGILRKNLVRITPEKLRGGVLADEVGLGKTIEVLSLIISHQIKINQNKSISTTRICDRCQDFVDKALFKTIKKSNKSGFKLPVICKKCLGPSDIFQSRATFVVCPINLLEQWKSEMETKVSNLKYFVYTGMRVEYVHPLSLIDYDVVITAYNILTSEFYHSGCFVGDREDKDFRYKRKYNSYPTPLAHIEFWRVVYDESQVAETKFNKISQMCCYIKSVNRWCVTGTPIHRSLDDVEGIFSLISYNPFQNRDIFKKFFYHELSLGKTDNLVNVFRQIMRRTEKSDIENELEIPGVENIVISLDFDPIELHYYLEYHSGNNLKFFKWYEHFKNLTDDQKINSKTHKKFVSQFNALRHLCSDPFHLLPKKTKLSHKQSESVYNMEEAMQKLIDKKKTDCEEFNRTVIFYMNGLAGVQMLAGEIDQALITYQSSINMYNKNKPYFVIDKLQKIHILHNYLSISQVKDESLKKELNGTIQEYLEASTAEMASSKTLINNIVLDIDQLEEGQPIENVFLSIIKDLSETTIKYLTQKIMQGIISMISDLEAADRKIILKQSKKCCIGEQKNVDHLSLMKDKKFSDNCHFCAIERRLTDLEKCLYDKTIHDQKNKELENMTGFRSKKDIDIIIKALSIERDQIESQKIVESWLNLVKKCFSSLRNYFNNVRNWFTSQDEIQMCCRRVKLDDVIKDSNSVPKHSEAALNIYISDYKASIEAHNKLLDCDLTQLRYFINLFEYSSKKTSFNKETCPICYDELGVKWIVLLCSHFLCDTCYQRFVKTADENDILECPICRSRSPTEEVFCNSASSTKISRISSLVNEILTNTVDDKIIIFSEWDSVLELCWLQLNKNNINSCLATNIQQLRSQLPLFMDSSEHRILLMNIRLGSKGITITCANHVVFADVCLNLHDEIQAIGRCYRIGQLKPIKVYHLMMKMTIEEKIFKHREITGS
ncbi:hypothetical protein HZS_2864, partial [Henneguya salminicola]